MSFCLMSHPHFQLAREQMEEHAIEVDKERQSHIGIEPGKPFALIPSVP